MENASSVLITLGPEPVPEIPPADSGAWGAQVCFYGRVRDTENGRPLSGIEYTAYPAMAQAEMERMTAALQAEFGAHPVRLHHRTGFVANGEASLLIAVAGRHSAESFALCEEYVRRLKISVPVWKHPVYRENP
jgi:molybdopterin synthase catalytic subunit